MELVTVLPVSGSRRVIPPRSAQIEDEVWFPALRIAFLRREKMSQVIRAAVVRYVGRHKGLLDADPEWPDAAMEEYRRNGRWSRR
jgi:hypothetical protein